MESIGDDKGLKGHYALRDRGQGHNPQCSRSSPDGSHDKLDVEGLRVDMVHLILYGFLKLKTGFHHLFFYHR